VPAWRVACGLAGFLLIWVAVVSPLAILDHQWLTAHMVQHLLLMSVASPLIWLSAPVIAMRHGLPQFAIAVVRSLCRLQIVQRIGRAIVRPAFCWCAAALTLTVWHLPAALTTAMHSNAWHLIQHASFLVSGLLFWWPVVQPWPSARTEPQWSMVLYLFLATLPCDVLAALLVFSERLAYPIYLVGSGRSEASVLADQEFAGALMWTCVTIIYLVAGTMVSLRLLAWPRSLRTSY